MPVVLLLAITLSGLLLRMYHLDRLSFWIDEGFSAWVTEVAPFSEWIRDVHPPLYYALLWLWETCSTTDWWLRLLSVLFGVMTIVVVYSLGKHMFGEEAGVWSAGFLSVLVIHIKHSQEARMYSLMVLLFAGALWGLVVGARETRIAGWIVYATSASLLAYTQGLAPVFVLVLAMLFPVVSAGALQWRRWFLANSVVALLFSPYLLVYTQHVRGVASRYWIPDPGSSPPILTNLLNSTVSTIPSPADILAHRLHVHVSTLLGEWLWLAPLLILMVLGLPRISPEHRWAVSTLLLAYALPILFLFGISRAIKPVLIQRVLLPTAIPVVVLLGSSATALSRRRGWRHVGGVLILVILLVADFYAFRYDANEEWKQASLLLQAHSRPTDVLLVNSRTGRFLMNRYDHQGVLKSMRQFSIQELAGPCGPNEAERCVDEAFRAYPARQTVWLVIGHESEVPPLVAPWVASHLDRRERVQLTGVFVERRVLVH
jgi:uncharacterized membrane protein